MVWRYERSRHHAQDLTGISGWTCVCAEYRLNSALLWKILKHAYLLFPWIWDLLPLDLRTGLNKRFRNVLLRNHNTRVPESEIQWPRCWIGYCWLFLPFLSVDIFGSLHSFYVQDLFFNRRIFTNNKSILLSGQSGLFESRMISFQHADLPLQSMRAQSIQPSLVYDFIFLCF